MRFTVRHCVSVLLVLIAFSASGSKLPDSIRQQIQSISSPNELYVFAYRRESSDPEVAIAAYESILERFSSSDVAVKAIERLDRLKSTQPREVAEGSEWRGRLVHFSEWFTYKVSTGSGLLDALGGGGLSEKFQITFEAIVEDEIGSDLKVIIKSAKVSDGKASIMGVNEARAYSQEVINSSLGRTRVLSKSAVGLKPGIKEAVIPSRLPSRVAMGRVKLNCNNPSGIDVDSIYRGTCLVNNGQYREARSEFERALKQTSQDARAMILAGIAQTYYLEGNLDRATEIFKAAFELRPEDEKSRANLVSMLVLLGRYTEAEVYAHDLPLGGSVLTELGIQSYNRGELLKATEYFERAMIANNYPSPAGPHYEAAVAYLAQGRIKEARAHLEALLTKEPSHSQAVWAREALGALQNKVP